MSSNPTSNNTSISYNTTNTSGGSNNSTPGRGMSTSNASFNPASFAAAAAAGAGSGSSGGASGYLASEASSNFSESMMNDPEVIESINLMGLRDSFDNLVKIRNSNASNIAVDSDLAESIPAEIFYEAVFNEFFKVRSYRIAAVFTSFVIVLCIILFINRIDVYASSSAYFSQKGALKLIRTDEFVKLKSLDGMYGWLDVVVRNLDKAREPVKNSFSAATPYPMGLILIRQLRGSTRTCTSANTFFSGLRPRVCAPDAALTNQPFGSLTDPELYKPNGQLPGSSVVDAQSIKGVYVGMSNSLYTFERHFYFAPVGTWSPPEIAPTIVTTTGAAGTGTTTSGNTTTSTTTTTTSTTSTTTTTSAATPPPTTTSTSTTVTATPAPSDLVQGRAAMLQELKDMRENRFINDSTWSIAIDVAFVHPALRTFTVVTALMEKLPSGVLRPTLESNTFLVSKLSFSELTAVLTFIADMFICLFVLYCIGELLADIYARYELSMHPTDAITASLVPIIITIGQIVTLSSVVADRFGIWSLLSSSTTQISDSSDTLYTARRTLHALSQISALLQSSYRNFSISILLCLFRLFVFSESLDGLNMLSRAMRLNGGELVTVLLLCASVLVMFGVAGNVFFDTHLTEYSTVRSTVSSLTRSLSSSSTDAWRQLAETAPRTAAIFFVLFWLTLWIVLLNMVLAIVVAAVDAVQRSATEGAKFDTTWFVLKRHVLMLGGFYSGCRVAPESLHRGGSAVAAAAIATKMPLPYTMRYDKWKTDYATRYSAVLNAKRWVESGEKEVHLSDLNLVLCSVPMHIRRQLYSTACDSYSAFKALRATRSRTADEVEQAARGIERQITLVERKCNLAPQQLPSVASPRSKEDQAELDEDMEEEDQEIVFERLLKQAVKSRAGMAEMMLTCRATEGFLAKEQN